jgi:hypothetical protein
MFIMQILHYKVCISDAKKTRRGVFSNWIGEEIQRFGLVDAPFLTIKFEEKDLTRELHDF